MFTDPEASIVVGREKAYKEHGQADSDRAREQYPFDQYADICYWGNGVGCDGGDCWCPCHSKHAPIFISNLEVEEWHSE